MEISRTDLVIGPIIGTGAFGEVCSASLSREKDVAKAMGGIQPPMFQGKTMTKMLEVAAKRAKVDVGVEATNAFLEEAMIMSQFHHRNILRLLGVCTTGISKGKPIILALELCQHGELKGFLRSSKEFRV